MPQETPAASEPRSPYRSARTYAHIPILILLLVAIGWFGLRPPFESRAWAWFLILALMTLFAVLVGHGITGKWRGILIDSRYKMSLSRLQMLAWTLVVLSALLTAVMQNLDVGWETPLEVQIPSELWVLLGISTASLVASPAILSRKRDQPASPGEVQRTVSALARQGYTHVQETAESLVVSNRDPDGARWGDLLKGEEVGNAATVDLGKLQMFFFTFILVLSYAIAIARMFQEPGPVLALPAVQEGMNTLLGISHTGYLANKTVTHSREVAPQEAETPGGGEGQ